jgi:hypothetical protein
MPSSRTVYSRSQGLHAGQGRGAVGARGEIGKARGAFGKGGQHAVAMADGFVAGQAKAADNVFGGTDEAFFCDGVQAGELSKSLAILRLKTAVKGNCSARMLWRV